MIRRSSLEALELICQATSFRSIDALLLNYTDYICFHVNTKIHHCDKFMEGLEILSFILKYTRMSSLIQLQSILHSIINTWDKVYTIRNIKPILEVFNLFFKKVLRNDFKDNEQLMTDNDNTTSEEPSCSDIPQSEISKLTTNILNAVLQVLSTKDNKRQIMCLDCLISGLPCLQNESKLLRICHLMWNPLVEKFKSKCVVTLQRCFQLLIVLSSMAKDFLRQRTLW